MKILYFIPDNDCEYESLLLLHGLYQIEGMEIYLNHSVAWLFSDYNGDVSAFYGKGFNNTKLVDSKKRQVFSHDEIIKNLKNHYFDIVIYGASYCYLPFLDEVLQYYSKNEVAFIDGADEDFGLRKDHISLHGLLPRMLPIWYFPIKIIKQAKRLRKKGIYFKREISWWNKGKYIPIQFAIPKELIVNDINSINKEIFTAHIYPGRKETYIYDNAKDYNEGYQKAMFGVTFKKAGWDCYRHYEILANGCIPYFPDIDKCPDDTMFLFPKNIIKQTNKLYLKWKNHEMTQKDVSIYNFYLGLLLDYTKNYLTTERLACYVLSFFGYDCK